MEFISCSGDLNQIVFEGLRYAGGNLICVMDVSLKESPRFLPPMIELIDKIDTNFDIVVTKNVSHTGESKITHFVNKFSKSGSFDSSRDYCLMKRSVADYILNQEEFSSFSMDFIENADFKMAWCEY